METLTPKERPILFNGPMVRAILGGKKTQSRRIIKINDKSGWHPEQPPVLGAITSDHPKKGEFGLFVKKEWGDGLDSKPLCEWDVMPCPYGKVGDRLWVRETWRRFDSSDECGCSESPCSCPPNGKFLYKATHCDGESKWRPSIHMPRSACRILLEITNIRVEQLTAITDEDSLAEGVDRTNTSIGGYAKERFKRLWESIGGVGSWAENPWVWVIEFKRIDHE